MSDILVNNVFSVLRALGNNATEVANSLKVRKIKGEKRAAEACPIRNYLASEGFSTNVSSENIEIRDASHNPSLISITTPNIIADFIDEFDRGWYPDLEEER